MTSLTGRSDRCPDPVRPPRYVSCVRRTLALRMAKAELQTTAEPRTPLNRERVLSAAVQLADREGVDALSMRRLSAELGVVPMALYKHVANKDELLDGMIDVVVAEIDPPRSDTDWKTAVRER